MQASLDSFDIKILHIWQREGDIGPGKMSEQVGLSASQCSRRMQQLRASGHIERIVARLEPARVNLGVCAYVLVTLSSHRSDAVTSLRKMILEMDEILECNAVTGEADLILKIVTHDLASLNKLINGVILPFPEVHRTRSSIVLEPMKNHDHLTLRYAR